MRPVHQCSLFSIYLEPLAINRGGGESLRLGGATGFLFHDSNRTYLVSNYHVLSGYNAETGQAMDKNGYLPGRIKVHFLLDSEGLPDCAIEYPLVDEDDTPLWQAHPTGGSVDIAALAITPPHNIAHFFLDEIEKAPGVRTDFFHVNQEVAVIGFPVDIRVGGRLPIWKRSVIATEPFSELSGNPKRLLIDTGSRPGMSGSPVIFSGTNLSAIKFDDRVIPVDLPSVKVALGIYSGRISGADEFAAQLGIVWSMQCVTDVVQNIRQGDEDRIE